MPYRYALYHMYDVVENSDSDESEPMSPSMLLNSTMHDNLFDMCEWNKDNHLLFNKINKCNFEHWCVPQYTPYSPDYLQFTQIFNRETYFTWLKMNKLPKKYTYDGVHWGYKKYNEDELLWMRNFVRDFGQTTGVDNKSWIWKCLLEVVSY